MHITSLQTQATNPDRINVFVDERFLLGASSLVVLQMGLEIGQELSPAQLDQLREEEALQQAVARALNYLSFRPRSREEVRRYLRRKETSPTLVERVFERLEQLDLVNDRAFASFWIESREHFNPKGARALKNELRMKGVEREVVDEMINDEKDEERALRAGHKKAASLVRQPTMDLATFRARLGSFLQRRGFGYEITKRTVLQLWKELKEDDEGDVDDADDF